MFQGKILTQNIANAIFPKIALKEEPRNTLRIHILHTITSLQIKRQSRSLKKEVPLIYNP